MEEIILGEEYQKNKKSNKTNIKIVSQKKYEEKKKIAKNIYRLEDKEYINTDEDIKNDIVKDIYKLQKDKKNDVFETNIKLELKFIEPYMCKIDRILENHAKSIKMSKIHVLYYIINNYENLSKNNDYKDLSKIDKFLIDCGNAKITIPTYKCDVEIRYDDEKELKEIKREKLQKYEEELERIKNIYKKFTEEYMRLPIKNKHLSNNPKHNKNGLTSYCNVSENISLLDEKYFYNDETRESIKKCIVELWKKILIDKKYIDNDIQKLNKKNNHDGKFVIILINEMFNKYIDMINYNINILKDDSFLTEEIEKYLYDLTNNDFMLENDDIIILNNDVMMNIIYINNKSKEQVEAKKIKLFKTDGNRFDIIFTN